MACGWAGRDGDGTNRRAPARPAAPPALGAARHGASLTLCVHALNRMGNPSIRRSRREQPGPPASDCRPHSPHDTSVQARPSEDPINRTQRVVWRHSASRAHAVVRLGEPRSRPVRLAWVPACAGGLGLPLRAFRSASRLGLPSRQHRMMNPLSALHSLPLCNLSLTHCSDTLRSKR